MQALVHPRPDVALGSELAIRSLSIPSRLDYILVDRASNVRLLFHNRPGRIIRQSDGSISEPFAL